jgi:hypothetical protein
LREEDRTPANWRRIVVYYRNLVNTVVICPDGVLVMKLTGNPSGSVNTINDNTLILYTLLAYAWIRVTPQELRSLASFEAHTAKALVGDDNTWTVSDVAHEYYNARSVIAEWKLLGVTTTTDSMEPRKPSELDFLSAHTVFSHGQAVPVYDRTKLMTSLLYANRTHLTPAVSLERTAAMLSIGWSDIPFRHFCRDVIDWLVMKYDPIMKDDPRWMLAKCQIQSDERYLALFLGYSPTYLHPQGVELSGRTVKLCQPDKSTMNSAKPKGTGGQQPGKKQGQNPRRRNRQRGPRTGGATKQQKRVRQRTRRAPRPLNQRSAGPGRMLGDVLGGMNRRKCRVEEHEFIYDVVGNGTNFGVVNGGNPFPLNPGQSSTFPWLSKQAAQWERYKIIQMKFEYRREVSEFATAGTIGKVMLSVDLDASDAPPTTKTQVLDTDNRLLAHGMPCENFGMIISGRVFHPTGQPLYIRPGGLPGATDIKTYDVGNLWVSTSGTSDNSTKLGELHVSYVVEFSIPILTPDAVSAPINNSVSQFYMAQATATTSVPVQATWNGAGTAFVNGLGIVNTAGSLVPPAGNYVVSTCVRFQDTSQEVASFTWTFQKNGAGITGVPQMLTGEESGGAGTLSASMSQTLYVSANGTDAFTTIISMSGAAGTLLYTPLQNWMAI